jgi:quinoprotein glucose dehydrogenase
MNTGEHLWMIPTGETPARIANLPQLQGIDIGNTGTGNAVPMVATANLLLYSDVDGAGTPQLFAIDKATGEEVGRVEVPAASRYGMSSWTHDGHQYVILQTGSTLTAMAMPGAAADSSGAH